MPLLLLLVFAFVFGLAFWLGLGLAGWWWLGRLGIELEWNPLSAASRAARAERAGRYGEALRWYARAGSGERLLTSTLLYGLPCWPVRDVLIEVGRELVGLERGTLLARAAGIPEAMTQAVAEEAERAAEAFWRSAELGREMQQLLDLLETVRDLRQELAALTLSGTPGSDDRDEARSLHLRLRALAQIARELTEHRHATAA